MKKNTSNHTLPPFTRALLSYTQKKRIDFDTPGHHSGAFYKETTPGKEFFKAFGPAMFETDISDSQSVLGDPTSHEGPAGEAEQLAAKVFHADRTWFVIHGTSVSNRICAEALLGPGDLVLFDRNNHKSTWQGALLQTGATPVYLPSERNDLGVIGGLSSTVYDIKHLRKLAEKIAPERAQEKRPFRLACLQLCTYDGVFSNVPLLLKTLGRLCDYILFDAAWAGYESFIPLMKDYSPLTQPLTPEDPGILVTQSVHKQMAGFSMLSQIHKKDRHIKGQKRYLPDTVLNNAFLMNISTSPYFPFYAALEMNAYIHGKAGMKLWEKALRFSISLRKEILKECRYFKPFLPPAVHNKSWESYSTSHIMSHRKFFAVSPKETWHGFHQVLKDQFLIDPCKILIYADKKYKIPASLVSLFFESRHITPEKNDTHTLLFLAVPGDKKPKAHELVSALQDFETFYDQNAPVGHIFPHTQLNPKQCLRDLCEEIYNFSESHHIDLYQERLFSSAYFPIQAMNPRKANEALVQGKGELIPIEKAQDRIALECAMPYPPGICAIGAGERWTETACRYFEFLNDFSQKYPDLSPELLGAHQDGHHRLMVWVLKE